MNRLKFNEVSRGCGQEISVFGPSIKMIPTTCSFNHYEQTSNFSTFACTFLSFVGRKNLSSVSLVVTRLTTRIQ